MLAHVMDDKEWVCANVQRATGIVEEMINRAKVTRDRGKVETQLMMMTEALVIMGKQNETLRKQSLSGDQQWINDNMLTTYYYKGRRLSSSLHDWDTNELQTKLKVAWIHFSFARHDDRNRFSVSLRFESASSVTESELLTFDLSAGLTSNLANCRSWFKERKLIEIKLA